MIIYIIGMSGSGKTTLGKILYERLSQSEEKWIFLDGDIVRAINNEDLGHSIDDRRKNAYRISNLCKFLSSQKINVITCVLNNFHENQKFNKENLINYKEIYLDVKFDNLVKRDNKGIYKKALEGNLNNVIGVDIDFIPPYSPDIIIDNNAENTNFEDIASDVIKKLDLDFDLKYKYTRVNLLKCPTKYEYSKFEGKDFLKKFKIDREVSLDFLKNRNKKLGNKSSQDIFSSKINYKCQEHIILKDFLNFLYSSNDEDLERFRNLIELLIKKFELSKKLYLTYELDKLKKSSKKFDEFINYPLFSLVLQKYYYKTKTKKKLVYLNAILKLNDIISSIKYEFILSEEVMYSIKAINGELNIMGEYL